jgi:hypothetical protein
VKKRIPKPDVKGKNCPKLLVAMTGKASDAKTAEGDKPVFDYIASLPQPQRGIAERVDALAAKTLPSLQRAVKWDSDWDGQVHARRRIEIRERARRTASSLVDETGRREPLFRGKETETMTT